MFCHVVPRKIWKPWVGSQNTDFNFVCPRCRNLTQMLWLRVKREHLLQCGVWRFTVNGYRVPEMLLVYKHRGSRGISGKKNSGSTLKADSSTYFRPKKLRPSLGFYLWPVNFFLRDVKNFLYVWKPLELDWMCQWWGIKFESAKVSRHMLHENQLFYSRDACLLFYSCS
jgi:hypothetical protein